MLFCFRLGQAQGCWRRYRCRGAVTVPAVAGAFSTRQCVEIAADGGEMTVALKVAREHPGEGVGLMVAANSGRPGGAVGLTDRFDRSQVHPNHRTQEEDIMSAASAAALRSAT